MCACFLHYTELRLLLRQQEFRLCPDCRRWTLRNSYGPLRFFFAHGTDGACRVLLRHNGAKIGPSVKEQAKTLEDPWVPLAFSKAKR
jgi:hypothetical protein